MVPVHDYLNHAFRHITLYLLGDRAEPHLEHAAWNCLAAIQSEVLYPELSAPHMLGPGAKLTPEAVAYLESGADERAAARQRGDFATSGEWRTKDLPEIKSILLDRMFSVHVQKPKDDAGCWTQILDFLSEKYDDTIRGTDPLPAV